MKSINYKTFKTEFNKVLKELNTYYNKYTEIQTEFNLENKLKQFPIINYKQITNLNEELRKILATPISESIQTKHQLEQYTLSSAKDLSETKNILFSIISKICLINHQNINGDEKSKIYRLAKIFTEKYTVKTIYSLLEKEFERLYKLNGKILN